ncbi:hypothetical protein HDV04_002109 [Boothiomyces sp. JEL0838]|nr:hypothetical protein HDV04_002109 [Boothiomyces sp. JEL0838]
MAYRPRTSSSGRDVGLRQNNSSFEERTTLTNPTNLFQRSNSTISVVTDTSRSDTPNELANQVQNLIIQTQQRGSESDQMSAKLIYHTNYGGKMEFTLRKNETTIGRSKDINDINLPDFKISKRHASVIKTAEGYFIKDTDSSNGVRINDSLIEPKILHKLTDGDVIMIGPISLLFQADNHQDTASNADSDNKYLNLVTILPSERKYDDTTEIRAELEAEDDVAFQRIEVVDDVETLRGDYEKLRMAYELSKMSVTDDINKLLSKSLDMIFEILPLDRGVVCLVDPSTGYLSIQYVKLRHGLANEKREILLSSTILYKVFYTRKCLVTSDAYEDPTLGRAASVRHGQIRSVICVPLIAHNKVYGILHLDSRDRINAYSNKDLSLVKTIGNQTAAVIENMNLIKEVEAKAKITDQLSRFLPPHVVQKMTNRSEIIRKGGSEMTGTVVFADIRGFTNLSEKSTPMEVVNLLNEFFERLVKIVFKYDGIVDKYIGDCLMAVFGTLEDQKEAEYRAAAAALEFVKAIQDMNHERSRAGKETISIGVGINTGLLLAGFIGSSQRLEYTCIGDTVNTASRIQSMASADKVLLSQATYDCIKDKVVCQPVGYSKFKGKDKEVMIYEAIELSP